jgi:hypothetical protein
MALSYREAAAQVNHKIGEPIGLRWIVGFVDKLMNAVPLS